MAIIISFKSIFAYSDANRGFYHDLSGTTSIIHGANTSGKSTLIQTILYAMGINDMNKYVGQLYNKDYIIRLDIELKDETKRIPIVFVRGEGFIKVKVGDNPTVEFNGISSDSSAEHKRLKCYLRDLFGYSLKLYQGTDYKDASIETLWLPYYICQSVGWVSIRKTFEGLDYYRNFRESFIDYCAGIVDAGDMDEKDKLEKEIKILQTKIAALESAKEANKDRQINYLKSDLITTQCTKYIEDFSVSEHDLQELHYEYTKQCEKLSFLNIRKQVLKDTKKNLKAHNHQGIGICPVCGHQMGDFIEGFYYYQQDVNDTESQISDIQAKIASISSTINQIKKRIEERTTEIEQARTTVHSLFDEKNGITFEDWLSGQIQAKLNGTLDEDIIGFQKELASHKEKLALYRTDEQIKQERLTVSGKFKTIFKSYLDELNVNYMQYLEENRYFDVYKISALPYQGVELLKALMAYHFAFNEVVRISGKMPRLPFMLDAIFKEDIEDENKKLILRFISNHLPEDTQLIFSMADTEEANSQIASEDTNIKYFGGQANLIRTGAAPRTLIYDLPNSISPLIDETEDL